jgi:hypothetical protein
MPVALSATSCITAPQGLSSREGANKPSDTRRYVVLSSTSAIGLAISPDLAQQLISDSSGFYVEMHTDLNPQGAARGQLLTLHNGRRANFNSGLSPANEVPPVTNRDRSGSGNVDMLFFLDQNPGYNPTGEIELHLSLTGFRRKDNLLSIQFSRGTAGQSGPAVIEVVFANPVRMKGGALDRIVVLLGEAYDVVQQIYNDPAGYYFEVKTDFTPDGAARGQVQRGGPNP